jgi:DNA-binding response OmpR family regulator
MPEKLPCLYFEVEDTGEGIPHEFLLNIFDRFYKVDHTELNKEGTGIGLSLTKQLILKHKGDIQVESHPGRGSTFRFFIPIHKACFYEDEIVYEQVDLDDKVFAIKAMDKPDNDAEPESMKNKENVLLIVEDSEDVRAYIRGYFNEHYRILEACNGKKGCEFAFKEIPDLIISDVMMPEMNGLEMCERLKRDERTSHIPLILLTAKTGEENQMKGLEYGVDDYITKPFNINALKLKIENILKRRDLLQQRILSGFDPGSVQNVSPVDEKFLSKLNAIIEARLSDTELNAEELASDICYSRSHLYRKIKALTGRNITEYIRMYRLNKAAGLIQSKAFSVSEVAYKVGYNNPSYFSKTFKELFGKSPQEYL